MNNPQLVRIEPDKMTVDRVRQVMYYPSNDEKPRLLVGLLKQIPRRSMVFVNTRRAAEDVERILRGNGINAEAISGDVPQRKRLRMLRDFHEGTLAVLIGTDVASRGLHIPDVSHVFNYDLPNDPEDYVHRIGRTARAGAEGDAISFGCEEYAISVPDIEAYINRKLPVSPVPLELLPDLAPSESRHKQRTRLHDETGEPIDGGHGSHGGRGGQRGSGRRPGRNQSRGSRPPHRNERREAQPQPKPPSASNQAAPSEGNAPSDPNKRRRRRRGGRGRGGAPGSQSNVPDTPTTT
jgi:ATP-dependent RNA helicase RhlB